jgi:hypothetical protein
VHPFFFAREEYVEEAWPIVDPVLKADTQSMNLSRTRGERAKSIKSLAHRAESRRSRLIRIGDVFMKIEIFADADSGA